MPLNNKKKCAKCKKEKSVRSFYKIKGVLFSYCKECERKRQNSKKVNGYADSIRYDITDLQKMLCSYLGISFEEATGPRIKNDDALKRHIIVYFAKKFTDLSLLKIANAFGKKDHTAVIHSQKVIIDYRKTYSFFNNKLDKMTKKLKVRNAPYFYKNQWTDVIQRLRKSTNKSEFTVRDAAKMRNFTKN
jgi:hypothetical protein